MSFAAGGWVYEQAVGSPAKKLILLVLAEHYNRETKVSFPSVARMAAISECDERTVRKSLKDLTDAGHIADTGRRTGQQKNVVVWKMPLFEAHIEAKPANPDKNVGVDASAASGSTQPADGVNNSDGQTTENSQPLQKCQGSGETGVVPHESTLTKMSPNPDIFAPATLTKMSGESSLQNPLLTSGGAQAPARAIPAGSRGGGAPGAGATFDAASSLAYWYNHALSHALRSASALGICAFGVQRLDGLPHLFRMHLKSVLAQLVDEAVNQDQKISAEPDAHRRRLMRVDIENSITTRLDREIKPFIPPAASQRRQTVAA